MTQAEKILNRYIKGDIERDYDKASRNEHTVTLETALKAIEQALKISSKRVLADSLPLSGKEVRCDHCGKLICDDDTTT